MKIFLFGKLADTLGHEIEAELPPAGCAVSDLRSMLVDLDPAYVPLSQLTARVCVDQVVVGEDHLVLPGDEVAFVPPVSGG